MVHRAAFLCENALVVFTPLVEQIFWPGVYSFRYVRVDLRSR